MKTRDDYVLDSGGFLDQMDGAIAEAIFEIASGKYADTMIAGDPNAKAGVMLRLTINSPDVERPISQFYSVGSEDQWAISEDGRSVTNVKNADKHMFRKNSRAGSLVEAMMTAVGGGELAKGQDWFIGRDVYMTDAKFFENLNFYWENQKLPMVKEGETRDVPLPAKFLGEVKGGGKAGAPGTAPEDTTELDLLVVANASGKTMPELKTWAIKEPTIKANKAFMQAVVSGKQLKKLEDEGLLTLGADGKYA